MSLPDHMLSEPEDPGWCQEHAAPRPCAACESEEMDRRFDAMREVQP